MELPALLHSVSYAGLWGQDRLTIEQFIEKAADLGFEGVMLMAKRPHVSVLDYGPRERTALRKQMERRGLSTVVIAGYNNFTGDMEHGEVPHLEIQVAYLTELARLAGDLGSSLVRVFTGYENPAGTQAAQWSLVVRGLREASKRAADFGVTIGVQNHHDVAAGFESLHDLIRAVNEPNCKPLFDAWAPALHGADLSAGARLFGGLTPHTTVANYVRRPRYSYRPELVNYVAETPYVQAVQMDEGFIDYHSFWNEMYAAGFRGSVAYEMCSPLLEGNTMEVLDAHARRFLEVYNSFRESKRRAAGAD